MKIEAWLPHVQLPGCPVSMALDAIRSAAREFCQNTLAWQYTQDAVTVYVGESEYPYEPPSKADVVQPMYGFFNGNKITVKTPQELSELYAGNWMTMTGTPRHIVHLTPRHAKLVPAPDEKVVNALMVRIAIKPKLNATEIDDVVFDEYRDTIAAGAKARLKMMSGEPFYNVDGAKIDQQRFLSGMADERIRVWRGHGSGTLTARPRSKFA